MVLRTGNTDVRHISLLDFLRFLAAFSVLLYHFAFRGYAADNFTAVSTPFLADFAKYGYLGVHVFFIISGFVISMSLKGRSPAEFFYFRTIRLFPAFWLCCTLTYLWLLIVDGHSLGLGRFLINLTMLADFFNVESIDGAYWSLYVEINFYLLAFLYLLIGKKASFFKMLCGWLFLSLVSYFFPIGGTLATLGRFSFAPLFICGAIFYLIYAEGLKKSYMLALTISSVLAVLYSLKELKGIEAYYKTSFSEYILIMVMVMSLALFLMMSLRKIHFRTTPLIRSLGAITYPLYLIHQNIGYSLLNLLSNHLNPYINLLVVTASLVLFSYVLAEFYEKPIMIKLKNLVKSSLNN